MSKNLVVGIDSSTTATKAVAWTRDGVMIAEGRAAIPLANPAENHYEQDPLDWWRSTVEALRQLTQQAPAGRIAAIAISNQRETFVPLDEAGHAVRPAIVWLDQRCRGDVPWLAGRVGETRIHQITGKPVDTAPVAYRLAWMLHYDADHFHATAMFADVHAYLTWRLTGLFRTSWASADPLGLFDLEAKAWSSPILQELGVSTDQLPQAHAPGSILGEITASAAAQTGLAEGTPVVAGGGDGQAAGLGVNALSPGRAYLNLGTAVVGGVYSAKYNVDSAWRTMGSCSGEGYYYETSLRTGTFLVDWFARNIRGVDPESDRSIYKRLEAEASAVPPGSHGLLLVPYWGAVMTPYWDPQARGAIVGFTSAHTRLDMYRALLEGVALEQTLVTAMIEERAGVAVREFIAIGGGAASDLWLRIVADTSGKVVRRSQTVEASSLGAAVCAAVGANLYSSMSQAAEAMSGAICWEAVPDPANTAVYRELMESYRELYPRLRESFRRLSRFT